MFARFRNLFSKSKTETTPRKEPTAETAEYANVHGNGGIDKTRSDTNFDRTKESVSAETDIVLSENNGTISDTISIPAADQAMAVACDEQKSEQAMKIELTKIPQQNVPQSNGNIVDELSTATLGSKFTADEDTLDTNLNKNKYNEVGESINKTKNEKIKEHDCASLSEEISAAAGEEAAADYGSLVLELFKVDKKKIEVNTQLVDFDEMLNVGAHVVDESGQLTTNLLSLNATNNSDIAKTSAKTNDTLVDHLIDTTPQQKKLAANENFQIGSSIAVDGLATDASSSAGDTFTQTSTADATTASGSTAEPSTIIIEPTGNNEIACTAISNKLQEIAVVAESLDASIRDVQQDAEALEVNTTSTAEKKREAMRSNSSEDWHSRSTEDDSFVTASEGNFTPHSHSSSYQTASGRTSSYISSDKNSFDVSEADDSTFASAYEMPADINMSFDGSEQSFASAQQQESTPSPHHQPHKIEEPSVGGAYALPPAAGEGVNDGDGDGSSIADVEELHSQSVTPTPGDGDVQQCYFQSIPVESESEYDASCIVDAPSIEMLTEIEPVTSVTPEVSTCSNTTLQQTQNHNNTNTTPTNSNSNNNNNSQKPNAAWRRSKYYENITKQTIKGFL